MTVRKKYKTGKSDENGVLLPPSVTRYLNLCVVCDLTGDPDLEFDEDG